MTTDAVRPPEKQYGYSNAFSGLVSLVKEEGVRGLTRGLGANTVWTFISILYIFTDFVVV
jgi:dicarboxylate transporter 10